MIPCPLWQQAKNQPKAIAIKDRDRSWTFHEWNLQAEKWAYSLKQSGIDKKDRIAIIAKDPLTTAAVLFGALRVGCAIALQSDRDPSEAIHDQRSRFQLKPCPQENDVNFIESIEAPLVDDTSIATILFTSGSTGVPKAVCHNLNGHLLAAKSSEERTPFSPGDRWGLSLSLWHIGGLALLFRGVVSGGSIYCIPNKGTLSIAVATFKLTHLSVVALQLKRLVEEECDLSSLKAILVGGGPCSNEIFKRSIESNLPVKMTYGMTELGSQFCTQATPNGAENAGKPLNNWAIKITPEGEICAKGPSLLIGYLSAINLITATDKEGWFHTGDKGFLKNGCLYPTGRMDQRFISGGENISPEEIERVAMEHSNCNQAIAVPIPDKTYGHRPFLFYDGEVSKSDLERWLKNKLAKFKQPDHIYPWPSAISLYKPSRSALLQAALELLKQSNPSPLSIPIKTSK